MVEKGDNIKMNPEVIGYGDMKRFAVDNDHMRFSVFGFSYKKQRLLVGHFRNIQIVLLPPWRREIFHFRFDHGN